MATQYNRIDDNGLIYILTLLKPIIEAAGDNNIIEVIQKNGVALTVNNKTVNIEVPTDADIRGIVTGYGYQTEAEVNAAIDAALEDVTGIDFQIVQTLPQTGEKGIIYLVPNNTLGSNIYDEYIYVFVSPGYRFEKIGSTDIDLSGYVQASEMHALTNTEIDAIFAEVFA